MRGGAGEKIVSGEKILQGKKSLRHYVHYIIVDMEGPLIVDTIEGLRAPATLQTLHSSLTSERVMAGRMEGVAA